MKLGEIKKHGFTVTEKAPKREIEKGLIYSAEVVIEGNKGYWVIFETVADSLRFQFLQSPNDYKVKEKLFGIDLVKSFVYTRKRGFAPKNVHLMLPDKWVIKDKNVERKLEVVVSNFDQENDQLLHEIYSKTRGKA